MRYPEHLSDIGYYKKLLEQYSKEYHEFPRKSVIAGSITIILNAISDLIEKTPSGRKSWEI